MKELSQNPDYPIFEKSVLENKKFCLAKITKLLHFFCYRRETITPELAKKILWEICSRVNTSKKFKKEKCEYFKAYFYNVAKSVINNKVKKDGEEKHRGNVHLPTGIEEDVEDELRYFLEHQPDTAISPLDEMIFQESLDKISVLLEPDETAWYVYNYMLDGYSSPQICELVGRPISEIENAKRRIKRVVNKVIPSMHKSLNKKELQCRTTELKI